MNHQQAYDKLRQSKSDLMILLSCLINDEDSYKLAMSIFKNIDEIQDSEHQHILNEMKNGTWKS